MKTDIMLFGRLVSCLLASTMLFGCTSKTIQIFETNSLFSENTSNQHVFENDTLRITYAFWASKGIMSFEVFNKLDQPFFIDWRNSSFIYKDDKFNYWVDEALVNTTSYYKGLYYAGPAIPRGMGVSRGVQNTTSSTFKPEKTTFIPPKSKYKREQFILFSQSYYKFNKNSQKETVFRNDKPKSKTKVYFEKFTIDNSPIRFRNFLAISMKENSGEFVYFDSGFYLAKASEMDYRHYRGKYLGRDENGKTIYEKSFKNDRSFYLIIPEKYTVNYRKKYW